MDDFRIISVSREKGHSTKIEKNPTKYKLIGKGAQGAVFKISPNKCVKIYHNSKHKKAEEGVLKLAKNSSFFPNIFESGSNFIVMEYVKGQYLDDYLKQKNLIPEFITEQLIEMIKEMEQLKLSRCDAKLRHIIITDSNKLKVIDHVNSQRIKIKIPKYLFKQLNEAGHLRAFTKQVKTKDKVTYEKWKNTMKKHLS